MCIVKDEQQASVEFTDIAEPMSPKRTLRPLSIPPLSMGKLNKEVGDITGGGGDSAVPAADPTPADAASDVPAAKPVMRLESYEV